MEDDIDIYEDLPGFDTKHAEGFPEANIDEVIVREHQEFKQQVAELAAKLEDLQKMNANLEVNLSSLLKTAKAEIARKDEMIRNLRKELDDASFRRGSYRRNGRRFVHREPQAAAETAEETWDYRSYHTENRLPSPEEMDPSDELVDQQKRQKHGEQAPVTVFGERLRKRIMDEVNAEKMAKQSHKLISDGNSRDSGEACIAESDKENGTQCNVHSLDSKESQSCKGERESSVESGRSKTSNKTMDLRSIDQQQTDAGHRQRSACAAKYVGKRTNEDSSEPISVKRAKTEKDVDRLSPELKEEDLNGYEEENLSRHTELRHYYPRLPESEKLNGSTKEQQHRCFDVAGSRRNSERRNSREDSDGYNSKWHGRSTRRSKSPFDSGNVDRRYCEISKYSKRDDYRTKHRESPKDYHVDRSCRRAVDHRSRGKSPPNLKYRDERHKRRKLDTKHESYDPREKFEKRHDFRKNCNNKWDTDAKKQTYDLRNSIKRLSNNRRAGSAECVDYDRKYDRHERTRMRSADRWNKQERRKGENEESNRESSTEVELNKDLRQSIERDSDRNSPYEAREYVDYDRKLHRHERIKIQNFDRSNKRERPKSEIEGSNREFGTDVEPFKDSRSSIERNSDRNGPDETREYVDSYRKHDRQEGTRLRNVDRSSKHERRRGEMEESNRESSTEAEPIRDSRQNTEKDGHRNASDDVVDEQRSSETSNRFNQSKCLDKLEDGEIPSSPEYCAYNGARISQNDDSNISKPRPSSLRRTSAEMTTEQKHSAETSKIDRDSSCENSKVDPVPCATVMPDNAATLSDSEQRIGNIENVENLENIEKFIRDYGSGSPNPERSPSSDTMSKNCMVNKSEIKEIEKESDKELSIDIVKVLNDSSNIDDVIETAECELKPKISDGGPQNELFVAPVDNDCGPVKKIESDFNVLQTPITSTSSDLDTKSNDDRTSGLGDCISKCSFDNSSATTKTNAKIIETPIEEKQHVSENEGAMVISRADNDPSIRDTREHSNHCRSVEDKFAKSTVTEANNEGGDVKSTGGDRNRIKELVENGQKVTSLKTKSSSVNQVKEAKKTEKPILERSNVNARINQPTVKVQGKVILLARRRNPVRLTNNTASMTILANSSNTVCSIGNASENVALKPRACKVARIHKNT